MTAVRSEPPRLALGDKPEGEGNARETWLLGRKFQQCPVRHHHMNMIITMYTITKKKKNINKYKKQHTHNYGLLNKLFFRQKGKREIEGERD